MSAESPRKRSPRIRRKRRQARREILDAAKRILSEQGIDAVTLASVAGELGMTRQALYHYFPSKDALERSLVVALLDEEVEVLVAAVQAAKAPGQVLGTLIRAFYQHYVHRLDAFRMIYTRQQLNLASELTLDPETIHEEINPLTRRLFDVLEERLAGAGSGPSHRVGKRRLAFTAWTAALGLVTILSVTEAAGDPLVHGTPALLDTLSGVFDQAALEEG